MLGEVKSSLEFENGSDKRPELRLDQPPHLSFIISVILNLFQVMQFQSDNRGTISIKEHSLILIYSVIN